MSSSRPDKPKILVLTSTFPRRPGDVEPGFVLELTKRLQPDYAALVLAPHGPKMKRRETVEGVQVVRFRYCFEPWERLAYEGGILAALKTRRWTAWLLPLFLMSELMAAVRWLRREPIAVIHAHWLLPQGLLALVARGLAGRRIPILCTSHGGDLFALRDRFSTALKRWVLRRTDGLTVVSQAMKQEVLKICRGLPAVAVIPMGIDCRERFTPGSGATGERMKSILFVGRLVEKKGLRYLLEAFAEVAKDHPEWVLQIVGSGPLRPSLEELAKRLGCSARVQFLGGVANYRLPEWYRQAGMAVFPFMVDPSGDREGFGLVVAEALGCACPVVAGDVPAVRDLVRHETTGLLVPEKDGAALARAIRRLMADEQLGRELGRAGRMFVCNRFAWDTIAARYRTVLDGLVAGQERAPRRDLGPGGGSDRGPGQDLSDCANEPAKPGSG